MPRKRNVTVVLSSDEEEAPSTTPNTPKGSIEAAFARASSKRNPSHSTSPSKPIKLPQPNSKPSTRSSKSRASQPASQTNSPNAKPKSKSKDQKIHSFFNAATQKLQSLGSSAPTKTASQPLDLDEDLIQDDSDNGPVERNVGKPSLVLGRKRKADEAEGRLTGDLPFPQGSQKFLIPSSASSVNGTALRNAVAVKNETRPWTDEYGPFGLDELAVHKKKVQDVSDWLTRTVGGKDRKRLLVLKGGAGTGKTTTVRLISQQFGLQITEWRNPESTRSQDGHASIASQFEDFVTRTSVFGTLTFDDAHLPKISPAEADRDRRNIILVEEFPNTFSRSSSALQSFRRAVTQYLQAVTPSMDDLFSKKRPKSPPIVPVIMIISETLLSTTTAAADSFTAHRLLGPEILNHPGTTVIEFNKIAPTFMSKALDLVLQKEADKSGRKVAPGPAVLKHLSETGDVRSAISALEFFCLHQGNSEDWSGKIRTRKAKKVKGDTAITPMEKQSLQMITQRESTLGIFHAVGKVVYNKREHPKATDTPPPQPPSHFPQHARPKVSEVNIETLINELGTDIDVFIAALHENYVLSCGGLTDEDTLDTINGCIDSLSDSDLLSPDRFLTSYSRYSFRGTTTDSLRQDEISFETSVRGILFHLPYPVKRATPPKEYSNNRGKGLSHATEYQMLYPTSMRLWRRKEQIEELVNLLNEKFRNGQFDESVHNPSRQSVAGGVDSWAKHARFSGGLDQMTPTSATPRTDEKIDSVEASFLVRGAGRSELLLERFPFMSALEKRKKKMKYKPSSSRSTTFKQLDKLTSFGGLTSILTNVEDEPEAEEAPAEQWSTDKPVEDGRRDWKKSVGVITTASDGHVVVKKNMESLVLSDDDIEDE